MKNIIKRFKPYPLLCNYYITTRCNARCVFCDIYKKKGIDAPLKDIAANLRDLKKIGVSFIDFTGGEPLIHPQIKNILETAKNLGFITTVTTNCILYPNLAQEIKGLVDLLHFSLDAPIKQEHDKLRGVKCYNKVIESINIAKSIREKPDILFTITEDNIKYLNKMIRFAQKNQCMLLCNPVFSYFNNPGLKKETLNKILSFSSEPYVYVNRGIIRFMKQGGNSIQNPRCRAVSTTIVISPDNYLLLPCYHKCSKKIPINNNLRSLMNSKTLNYFRKREGRFSFCKGCSISCYFDPSFTYGADDYFLLSQLSKIKYGIDKYIRTSSKSAKIKNI
ncbi:MAG: radical SAM protein [bacterium]